MEDIDSGRVASDRTPVSATSAPTAADIDLTGIDPVHWAETRERVEILRVWCANGRHPRYEAVAAAERMGMAERLARRHMSVVEIAARRGVHPLRAQVDAISANVPFLGAGGFCRRAAEALLFGNPAQSVTAEHKMVEPIQAVPKTRVQRDGRERH